MPVKPLLEITTPTVLTFFTLIKFTNVITGLAAVFTCIYWLGMIKHNIVNVHYKRSWLLWLKAIIATIRRRPKA